MSILSDFYSRYAGHVKAFEHASDGTPNNPSIVDDTILQKSGIIRDILSRFYVKGRGDVTNRADTDRKEFFFDENGVRINGRATTWKNRQAYFVRVIDSMIGDEIHVIFCGSFVVHASIENGWECAGGEYCPQAGIEHNAGFLACLSMVQFSLEEIWDLFQA